MGSKIVLCLAALLALPATAPPALAQGWPAKPLRIIVPYGTGGGSDILARQLGASLQPMWGQGVIVENRAGASGNIGTEAVVRSPADGYTLLLQNSTMVVNPAVSGTSNYDPEKDLTPILLLGVTPIALFAHPSANVRNLREIVAASKANPNAFSYGSCGNGTPQHFVMELLKLKAGFAATHVPYKGCAPGLADVVGGHVLLATLSANLGAPYVKSDKLRAIGVSSSTRYGLMPEVPTFEEQGLKPLDFSIWSALMGPAKMPADVVARITADVQRVLADPQVRGNLSSAGVEPVEGSATDLARLIQVDRARYVQLAKSANIKAD